VIGWKPQFNDPRVAGVRYRCLNPLRELQRRGFPAELFKPENIPNYSAVIFSKAHDEQSYAIASDLKRKGKSIIFDICDNHFYNPYHLPKFQAVRDRLIRMLAITDALVTSTSTLAEVICNEAGLPSDAVVISDALEENDLWFEKNYLQRLISRFRPKLDMDASKANILWYGIHGGESAPYGMLDLLNIRDVLCDLSKEYPLRLIVVSNSRRKFRKHIKSVLKDAVYFEWGDFPFREILRQADINVIPVSKNPFTLCKSNNRLVLSLYEGIPTVADEIPSYTEFGSFCVLNNWEYGLRLYLSNKRVAQEQVTRARAYIQEHYTIKQTGDQWVNLLSKFVD
jgi:hypothetical protein